MSMKNKKIIIMILVMISLASTVIAGPLDSLLNLQGIARSSGILAVIANAAIIFGVASLIFNLIKKGIGDEKAAKIVRYLVVGFSIVLAIELNKSNPGAFLWQMKFFSNFLHPAVIINAVAIGAGLMLLAEILLEKQMSPQLKIAIRIIVVIMAINIVMQPFQPDKTWDDVKGSYKYVWESSFWIRTRFYLFGASDCEYEGERGCYYESDIAAAMGGDAKEGKGDPRWGILTSNRMIVFVLLFFVIVLAFNTFVKTEIIGPKFIYAVSFLIASNMANTGTRIGNAIMLGQVILSITLAKAIREKGGASKTIRWISIIAAVLIVEFVTKTIFGDKAKTFLTPVMGPLMKDVLWVFKDGFQVWDIPLLPLVLLKNIFWHPKSLLIIIIIVILIGTTLKGKWARRLASEWGTKAVGGILRKLRTVKYKGFWRLFKFLKTQEGQKRTTPEDEEPPIFTELRPELHMMMNYNARISTYIEKRASVKTRLKIADYIYSGGHKPEGCHLTVEHQLGDTYMYLDRVRCDLHIYKNGTGFKSKDVMGRRIITNETETLPRKFFHAAPQTYSNYGWLGGTIAIMHLIEKEFYTDTFSFKYMNDPKNKNTVLERIKALRSVLDSVRDMLEKDYADYNKVFSMFSLHAILDSFRMEVFDQWNPDPVNYFIFAHPKAKIKETDTEIGKDGDKFIQANPRGWLLLGKNKYGEPVCGKYPNNETGDIKLTGKEKIHNLHALLFHNAVINLNFSDVCLWVDHAWHGYMDDLSDGRYHGNSRTAQCYIDEHKAGKDFYDDDAINQIHKPSQNNPAFDRQAMNNPGEFTYLGRRRIYDGAAEVPANLNPYPAVCTRGFATYLPYAIELDDRDTEEARREMMRYQWHVISEVPYHLDAAGLKAFRRKQLFIRAPKGFTKAEK